MSYQYAKNTVKLRIPAKIRDVVQNHNLKMSEVLENAMNAYIRGEVALDNIGGTTITTTAYCEESKVMAFEALANKADMSMNAATSQALVYELRRRGLL